MTLGFGDEIVAGARALPAMLPGGQRPGDVYREAVEAERAKLDDFRTAHPVMSFGAEMAGGIGTGFGAAGAARAVGMGARAAGSGRFLRVLGEGAAAGGVAGAGSAEGGAASRVRGAVTGAAAGGAFAGGLRGAGAAVRGARNVAGAESAPAGARRLLGRAMEADQVSVDDLRTAAAQAGGKPVNLADLGGENLRGLARGAQSVQSSRAKNLFQEILDRRQQGQRTRILGDLERASGRVSEDALTTGDALVAQRRTAAQPLYEKAYEISVKDPSGTITEVFELPAFQKAYQRAQRIARIEGEQLPNIFRTVTRRGKEVVELTDQPIPVKAFDLVKRGLDDVIDSGFRSGSIGKAEARALKGRLRDMLEEVDELVPEYKAARASYAGDSAMLDALEEGRTRFLREDPRLVARSLARLSPTEQEMYRVGALDALRQDIAGSKDQMDVVRRIFGDELSRKRLEVLFPDQAAFDELTRAMNVEGTMNRTRSMITGGSPTARIQDEQRELGAEAIDALARTAAGGANPTSLMLQFLGRGLMRLRGVTGKAANEIAERLTAEGPELMQVLDELGAATKAAGGRAQRGAGARAGAASVIGGSTAPSAPTPAPTPQPGPRAEIQDDEIERVLAENPGISAAQAVGILLGQEPPR